MCTRRMWRTPNTRRTAGIRPDREEGTIALAELVLDTDTGAYACATHYTTEVFRTERPWPVEIDLPALAAKMARYRR